MYELCFRFSIFLSLVYWLKGKSSLSAMLYVNFKQPLHIFNLYSICFTYFVVIRCIQHW